MKSVNEIGKAWKFCDDGIFGSEYIAIDEHATNFRPSTRASEAPIFAKIHIANNGRGYIWYKRHTYYIDENGKEN